MTEEKEQLKRRYFCFKKREVYRALLSVATSFVGALLALAVFSAVHKPPRVPGKFPPPPPPIERIDINIHKDAFGMGPHHPGEFQGRRHHEFREQAPHKRAMMHRNVENAGKKVNPPTPKN